MSAKKNHTLSGIVVIASCCLLLAGACENDDRIETDTPVKDVPLDFNATITNTTVAGSRAVTAIEGFTENSYSFGMSITKNKNDIFEGSGDMKATMSNPPANPGGKWDWTFQKIDGTIIHPRGPEGRELEVIAYYPLVNDGTDAFTNGIPFDFTDPANLHQTEILYNTNTSYTITPSTGAEEVTVPLNFQHAYSWIVINVTKYVAAGGEFRLSSVSIDNLSGEWIKNQGAINPKTGLVMEGAIPGAIGEVRVEGDVLSTTTPIKYEFLIPSFMDPGVGDGSLVISMMINGVREVFLLNKEHLNKDGNSYGFRQGYKNTYNLVFNNSSLNLNLLNWTSAEITSNFGESETITKNYRIVDYVNNTSEFYWGGKPPVGGIYQSTYLPNSDHRYESYLTTVAYGNNGKYVPVGEADTRTTWNCIDYINVRDMEPPRSRFMITKENMTALPVVWEDDNGQLIAKEICKKCREGGFENWRLPRASELRAVMYTTSFNGTTGGSMGLTNSQRYELFWTATEVNETQVWGAAFYNDDNDKNRGPILSPQDKRQVKASVRCVRDAS